MPQLYRFQSTDCVLFKLTLSGAGVTGITFNAADVKFYGVQTGSGSSLATNIGTSCTEIGSGLYRWDPPGVSYTAYEHIVLNIKATGGNIGKFDENCIILSTGGDVDAFYDGT